LLDKFGRTIDTIRISVTDKCNLKCYYCIPDETDYYSSKNILSYEEIYEVVKEAASLGITRAKLTGGEPLIRKEITKLIGLIRSVKQINDISITTNGTLLENLVIPLKEAGLDRINISLDSLDENLYKEITRGGELEKVISGIFFTNKYFYGKIKINTVLLKNKNENEIPKIKEFCNDNNLSFQLINQMNLQNDKHYSENFGTTNKPNDCSLCNRIRLTSDGKLLPCLFSNIEIDIKNFSNIKDALILCINQKIEKGEKRIDRNMVNIGG